MAGKAVPTAVAFAVFSAALLGTALLKPKAEREGRVGTQIPTRPTTPPPTPPDGSFGPWRPPTAATPTRRPRPTQAPQRSTPTWPGPLADSGKTTPPSGFTSNEFALLGLTCGVGAVILLCALIGCLIFYIRGDQRTRGNTFYDSERSSTAFSSPAAVAAETNRARTAATAVPEVKAPLKDVHVPLPTAIDAWPTKAYEQRDYDVPTLHQAPGTSDVYHSTTGRIQGEKNYWTVSTQGRHNSSVYSVSQQRAPSGYMPSIYQGYLPPSPTAGGQTKVYPPMY